MLPCEDDPHMRGDSSSLPYGGLYDRTHLAWHDARAKADEYLHLMRTIAVPDYQAIPGNRGVYVMRRMEGDMAHFLLLTLWDSADAIRQFAGEDMEKAKYYNFDASYLLELEPTVTHDEVFERPANI